MCSCVCLVVGVTGSPSPVCETANSDRLLAFRYRKMHSNRSSRAQSPQDDGQAFVKSKSASTSPRRQSSRGGDAGESRGNMHLSLSPQQQQQQQRRANAHQSPGGGDGDFFSSETPDSAESGGRRGGSRGSIVTSQAKGHMRRSSSAVTFSPISQGSSGSSGGSGRRSASSPPLHRTNSYAKRHAVAQSQNWGGPIPHSVGPARRRELEARERELQLERELGGMDRIKRRQWGRDRHGFAEGLGRGAGSGRDSMASRSAPVSPRRRDGPLEEALLLQPPSLGTETSRRLFEGGESSASRGGPSAWGRPPMGSGSSPRRRLSPTVESPSRALQNASTQVRVSTRDQACGEDDAAALVVGIFTQDQACGEDDAIALVESVHMQDQACGEDVVLTPEKEMADMATQTDAPAVRTPPPPPPLPAMMRSRSASSGMLSISLQGPLSSSNPEATPLHLPSLSSSSSPLSSSVCCLPCGMLPCVLLDWRLTENPCWWVKHTAVGSFHFRHQNSGGGSIVTTSC